MNNPIVPNEDLIGFTFDYNFYHFNVLGIEFVQHREGDDWTVKRGDETLILPHDALSDVVWDMLKKFGKKD